MNENKSPAVAAIDMGTNSFLLLVLGADGAVIHDESQIVKLGQGLNLTKKLHPDALSRANVTLTQFREKLDSIKMSGVEIKKTLALATSAARDASNSGDLKTICENLNIPLEIISGEREAELTFRGAVYGLNKNESLSVLDIGGGSTELVQGKEFINSRISLNIGCVRITEMFFEWEFSCETISKASEYIQKELNKIPLEIKNSTHWIAVAGTPTSLASIELGGFDPQRVDGYILSKSQLEIRLKQMQQSSTDQLVKTWGLQRGRAEVLPAGTLILLEIMNHLNISSIQVSTRGIRFGLAYELQQS